MIPNSAENSSLSGSRQKPEQTRPQLRIKKKSREIRFLRRRRAQVPLTAYAAAGAFDQAVEAAEKALELVAAADEQALAERIKSRLELYKAGKPYRD